MNYTEIKSATIGRDSISNREDADIANSFDTFLRIVEAKINRALKTPEMEQRATLLMVDGQEYYQLPPGFMGLRDIELRANDGSRIRRTMEFVSPEVMNSFANPDNTTPQGSIYYTIIANQIQIMPPKDGELMEVVYYKQITPLTETETNFISDYHPDCYIFGVLTEIGAMTMDMNAKQIWEERFNVSLTELDDFSNKKRWSGPAMHVKIG